MSDWQEEDILVTVRAYPNPSKGSVETSCVAGITLDGQPRRLYPIPDRLMSYEDRFKKYDVVRVRIRRPSKDRRPESRRVNFDVPIRQIGRIESHGNWQERDELVKPFRVDSMEEIAIKPGADAKHSRSLALIRPASIERLKITPTERSDWTDAERSILGQQVLLPNHPYVPLEYIPYKFRYWFHCAGQGCRGHRCLVVDWEMSEAYRKWSKAYGSGWESKFRDKFEIWMLKRDLQFFVGTMAGHQKTWIIIGLYYPPKVSSLQVSDQQLTLFSEMSRDHSSMAL